MLNKGPNTTLVTIGATMRKGRTHYITPAPQTMQKLTRDIHGYDRSTQTYWRNAKYLEDNDYINRGKRWNTRDRRNPRRRPSMITLTIKGAIELVKMGSAWAGQILGAMLKWAKKRDKRFPQPQRAENMEINDYETELAEIRSRADKLTLVLQG